MQRFFASVYPSSRRRLFVDGVYVERPDGAVRFRSVRAPTAAELTQLTDALARRVGRYLERQGWLAQDAENTYLAGDGLLHVYFRQQA